MPNWCDNRLTITGPDADVRRMRSEIRSEDSELDFDYILPIPKEMTEHSDDWYDWCVSIWGTKWSVRIDDSEGYAEDYPGGCSLSFLSAWAPPDGIVEQLSAMYPSLTFRLAFAEPGCGFAGVMELLGGELVFIEEQEGGQEAGRIAEREIGGYSAWAEGRDWYEDEE